MRYGFLGLGIMGSAMAANLLRAGFEVTVWNRSPDKTVPLVAAGARAAASPRAVVADSEITFAMLADPDAALAVALGPDGAILGAGPGHDYVDVSTVDAATSRRIAAEIAGTGARFLEAPVSGTRKPAEDGTLIFLAAGDRALYDDAAAALDVMGRKRVFLGEVGQGAHMKLVVNMVMGGMMVALAEGLALGRRAGLEGEGILDVLAAGAMACPMVAGKGALVLREEYAPHFPLKHMQKDLRLALALGDELHQPLPGVAAVNESFKRAVAAGLGDADMCAVAQVV